ncbi:hypothetical protein [Wenyingzhuangia aestuarii]|uniref:hypothetical protein n=1 Tax=Wenyingzhuangia aestuarii TaxID=1647582 RepID=UPI00143CA417|nr:hypothetical protein [Wenyingzhuangia aestuarii]NJB83621.1 hypothetical protein [Wenyingzhuangia aestuarii]
MFKNFFSTVGKIFSPGELGKSIISGVDKSILTSEEGIDYHKEFLKLYEPYKIAQRFLALMFTGVYLMVHLITSIAHFILVLMKQNAEHVIELYNYNNEGLGTIVLVIVSFYFGGGAIEGVVNKYKTKKENDKN